MLVCPWCGQSMELAARIGLRTAETEHDWRYQPPVKGLCRTCYEEWVEGQKESFFCEGCDKEVREIPLRACLYEDAFDECGYEVLTCSETCEEIRFIETFLCERCGREMWDRGHQMKYNFSEDHLDADGVMICLKCAQDIRKDDGYVLGDDDGYVFHEPVTGHGEITEDR